MLRYTHMRKTTALTTCTAYSESGICCLSPRLPVLSAAPLLTVTHSRWSLGRSESPREKNARAPAQEWGCAMGWGSSVLTCVRPQTRAALGVGAMRCDLLPLRCGRSLPNRGRAIEGWGGRTDSQCSSSRPDAAAQPHPKCAHHIGSLTRPSRGSRTQRLLPLYPRRDPLGPPRTPIPYGRASSESPFSDLTVSLTPSTSSVMLSQKHHVLNLRLSQLREVATSSASSALRTRNLRLRTERTTLATEAMLSARRHANSASVDA
ncbi:hypothetical protein B0H10DRAFT_47226 [Mycena sp. CBHHK59/15]|nr:hypothetical protein B0H10DRAFT_47226 [Mycena sp. CBHHK59/15]